MSEVEEKMALSPRTTVKLRSDSTVDGKPRKNRTVYEGVALSRGFTVKAGAATRARLARGIPKRDEWVAVPLIEVEDGES